MSPRRATFALAVAALLAAGAAHAQTAETSADSRDEELLGSSSETKARAGETTQSEASRDDEMFGEAAAAPTEQLVPPAVTEAPDELARVDMGALDKTLADNMDKLAIGGRVFVRSQFNVLERFDEADPALDPGTFALQSPNLLDIYLDARANDRLRVYVRTRTTYDPSVPEGVADVQGRLSQRLRTSLDQLWVKFDALRKVFFTVGKQRVKWGAGRFWNPTDFLNPVVLDPLAVIDERLGVSLVKIHFPIESLGWNFYGVIDLQDVAQVRDVGAAVRAELLLGPAEVTLSAEAKRSYPLRFGADLSAAVWLFDLHLEGALLYPDAAGVVKTVEGPIDFTTFRLPEQRDRKGEWIPQLVAGAEVSLPYSDQDSLALGAEFFFNGLGYDDATRYPALLLGQMSARRVLGTTFNPLYNGKYYAAAYAMLASPGNWNSTSFTASWLGNLSDQSHVVRLDYRVTLLTSLFANLYASHAFGESGEFKLGLKIPKVAFIDQLKNGLTLNPTVWTIGGGLIVNI